MPPGDVYIIPFVRDSAAQVNAGMIVYTGADTTLQYVCDWQYKDSTAVGMNSKDQMLLLMSLDQKVFGNRLYRIKDTAAFGQSSKTKNAVLYTRVMRALPGIANNQTTVAGKLVQTTVTVCYESYTATNYGQLAGVSPDKEYTFYTTTVECESISFWTESGGSSTTVTTASSGTPTSGGGTTTSVPPACSSPTTAARLAGKELVTTSCTVAWEPVVVTPEPTPVHSIADSIPKVLSKTCDKAMDSLYQWGMKNGFREQSFILVRKNGVIYAKNFKPGFPSGNKTDVNYTLSTGEELVAYVHTHAEDTLNYWRTSFSPDDLIEFNKNANFVGYTALLEVGNVRYAFVLENVQKKTTFNISKRRNHVNFYEAVLNTLEMQFPNGQIRSEEAWIKYLGSASNCGIGFYKATSPNKNNFVKLNP